MITYGDLLALTITTDRQYYYNANSSNPVNYNVTEESVSVYGNREVIHIEYISDKIYYGINL